MTPRFPLHLFAGTVDDYVRHRVPYPEPLIRDLLTRVPVTGQGTLIDLGCGPGRLTFRLASHFADVLACDLEPEMIAAAGRESTGRGVKHIRWETGLAEKLSPPEGSVELVTIGEAFHRLNQDVIVPAMQRWLKPGGAVATVGSYILANREIPWQRAVLAAVDRWSMPAVASTSPPTGLMGPDHDEQVLRDGGFVEVASHPFIVEHAWTAESLIGYLHSTSFASRRRLGDDVAAFDADVRAALAPFTVAGPIVDSIQFGYTFARKPA